MKYIKSFTYSEEAATKKEIILSGRKVHFIFGRTHLIRMQVIPYHNMQLYLFRCLFLVPLINSLSTQYLISLSILRAVIFFTKRNSFINKNYATTILSLYNEDL